MFGLVELHPYVYKASRDLIDYCKSNDILIETYSPLVSLFNKTGGPLDPVIDNLAKKYGQSPAQILLKWNLIKGLFFILFIYHGWLCYFRRRYDNNVE
jgi:diketogulonate reductase-like aldo/keto reductase